MHVLQNKELSSHSIIGIKLFVPPVYLWIIVHFTIGFSASKPNIMQIIMVKRYTKRAYKISGNYTDTPRTIIPHQIHHSENGFSGSVQSLIIYEA